MWGRMAVLLFLLLAGAGGLLVYQERQHQQQLAQVNQQQNALAKQMADLNDRLVALARQAPTVQPAAQPAALNTLSQSAQLLKLTLRQSLILAQTALDVGRIEDANQLLYYVQRTLYSAQQEQLSSAIGEGLKQAVLADQTQIAKRAAQVRHAQHQTDQALAKIQDYLAATAYMGPQLRAIDAAGQAQSWRQIFILEPVRSDRQQNIAVRALICHETALTLALARQALAQQQLDQYRQLLLTADQKIQGLPDPAAMQVHQWLQQLLSQPMPRVVVLQSLALLGTERAS